jgi:hypothetical protein
MNTQRLIKRSTKLAIAVAVFTLVASNTTSAQAANKTITCYKGTLTKKVTAVFPKCAAGWSTTKPKTASSATSGVAFSGTYKGKMTMVWSDSGVKITNLTATGTGSTLGMNDMTGTGAAAPQNQCDAFIGTGIFGGGGNTITVKVDPSAKACADGDAAPTGVTVVGNAVITGGTGKYSGASGTLKASGTFNIKSTDAGSSESAAFTLTITGNIVPKK